MKRVHAWLRRAEGVVAGVFLILMVVLIFLGGVARMAGHPLNWTTDLATCLFAWACFMAADIAWRNDNLMSIELLPAALGERGRRILAAINLLLIGGFLAYLVYAGLWLSWISRARSFQGIPAVSYSWVTMSLPVGGVLMLVTTTLKLRALLRAPAAEATAVR